MKKFAVLFLVIMGLSNARAEEVRIPPVDLSLYKNAVLAAKSEAQNNPSFVENCYNSDTFEAILPDSYLDYSIETLIKNAPTVIVDMQTEQPLLQFMLSLQNSQLYVVSVTTDADFKTLTRLEATQSSPDKAARSVTCYF